MANSSRSVTSLYSAKWKKKRDRIPQPLLNPNTAKINFREDYTMVSFDMEGTGLIHDGGEMVQLAAVYKDELGTEHTFNQYVTPVGDFAPIAAEITGFRKQGGELYKDGEKMATVSLYECLDTFIDWLYDIPGAVLLLAHNCFTYDAPLLSAAMEDQGLFDDFHAAVNDGGFGDTLTMMRDLYKGLRSYRLVDLQTTLLGGERNAHDAIDDAVALYDIVTLKKIKHNMLRNHSQKLDITYGEFCQKQTKNVVALRPKLTEIPGLSNIVMFYLTGAGYNLKNIKTVARTTGKRGVQELCGQVLGIRHCERNVTKIYDYVKT